MGFREAFRERRCLDFRELVHEHHHSLINEDLAEAFGRMMDACVPHQPDETSLFKHIRIICLWEMQRHATQVSWYLEYLIAVDPWNNAWQDICSPSLVAYPQPRRHTASTFYVIWYACLSRALGCRSLTPSHRIIRYMKAEDVLTAPHLSL